MGSRLRMIHNRKGKGESGRKIRPLASEGKWDRSRSNIA